MPEHFMDQIRRERLALDKPPHKPCKPAPVEPVRQKTLLTGLDCLSGQQDLFPTDGMPEIEAYHAVLHGGGKVDWRGLFED